MLVVWLVVTVVALETSTETGRRREEEGTVVVGMTINNDSVVGISLTTSSGRIKSHSG